MSRRSIVSSAELFAGAHEVAIEHADQCYLLFEGPDGELLLSDLPAPAGIISVPLHRTGRLHCRKPRASRPVKRLRDRG